MRLPFGWSLSRPVKQATANSADTPENAGFWRGLGSLRDGTRELAPADRDAALQTIGRMIEKDGLVSRMTQQIREWCVGDGVTLASCLKDEDAREKQEEALAALWAEPQTGWDDFSGEIAETIAPVGELLVTCNPSPVAGPSAFGVVSPEQIEDVVLNRNNARQTVGVLLKKNIGQSLPHFFFTADFREWAKENPKGAAASGFTPAAAAGPTTVVIPGAFGGITAQVGPDCLYFPWRRRLGATRGLSMFYPVADLIDALDNAIFQQVEGVSARNAWAVVIKTPGADLKTAQDMAKKIAHQMGKGGGHVGLAGDATMEVLAPNLGALQFDTHLTSMMKVVSAETGWPITWLGLGTDAGNASTTELAGPALRMMKLHQAVIAKAIRAMLVYGMKRMTRPASITEEDWLDFEVQLPEIGGRDMVRDSAALTQVAVAIDSGRGWAYTDEKAGEMLRRAFNKVTGDDFDAEDIPEEPEPVQAPPPFGAQVNSGDQMNEDPDDEQAKKDADDMEAMRLKGAKQARRG